MSPALLALLALESLAASLEASDATLSRARAMVSDTERRIRALTPASNNPLSERRESHGKQAA